MRITEEPMEAVAAEWDRLAEEQQSPPFLHPGWFEIWWRSFGKSELRVVTARDEGRLVGALPIYRQRGGIFSPTNWHTPLYGPVAESPEVIRRIFDYLVEKRARRLKLAFVDSELPVPGDITAGGRIHVDPVLRSPYLPIEGDWDEFWRSRSKNLRGTVRRCRNRLADIGTVELDVGTGDEALEARLAEGFRLEDSGWKEEKGTSIAAKPETQRFYRELAQWAAGKGFLRLAFLRIDGRAVAFNYCFELHGVHYLVKLGHDFDLHKFGPGTVLTAEMVERAFRTGLNSYEFLGGPDGYKLRWSRSCRERNRVQVFPSSFTGRIDEILHVHGRRIARRLLR